MCCIGPIVLISSPLVHWSYPYQNSLVRRLAVITLHKGRCRTTIFGFHFEGFEFSAIMSQQQQRPLVWMHFTTKEDKTDGIRDSFIEIVQENFDIVWYNDLKKDPKIGAKVTGALVAFNAKKFLKEQLSLMPNLKVIANFGAGYDGLDINALAKQGIHVSNTPDVLSDCVADMTIMIMISSARNLKQALKVIDEGVQTFDKNFMAAKVTGASLGIIGFGSIGKSIAKRARGFDMKIMYHSRNKKSEEEEQGAVYYGKLHNMLPECDFLVLACPLSKETTNLIAAQEFKLMKKSATIVNIARGPVIDHDALLTALKEKEIRGAALDVTDPEPLPKGHPLLQMEQVLITPHIGSATSETRHDMLRLCVKNLKAGLIDKLPLPNLIKPSI